MPMTPKREWGSQMSRWAIHLIVVVGTSFLLAGCRSDEPQLSQSPQGKEQTGIVAQDLDLSSSSVSLADCPNFVRIMNGSNVSNLSTPSYLSNNACWYFSDLSQSCEAFCKNFYGVDTSAMKQLVNNYAYCEEIVKKINPSQASKYLKASSSTTPQAPAGSACAWIISGKFPNLKWYIASQGTLNTKAQSTTTKQVCACDTEGFPNYMNLGLSYKNATGTSGRVGIPMLVKPTFLTAKDIYHQLGPIVCQTDKSTPLPPGLTLENATCNIKGTPSEALQSPQKFIIYAFDTKWSSGPNYRSNPAVVTLNITP